MRRRHSVVVGLLHTILLSVLLWRWHHVGRRSGNKDRNDHPWRNSLWNYNLYRKSRGRVNNHTPSWHQIRRDLDLNCHVPMRYKWLLMLGTGKLRESG